MSHLLVSQALKIGEAASCTVVTPVPILPAVAAIPDVSVFQKLFVNAPVVTVLAPVKPPGAAPVTTPLA